MKNYESTTLEFKTSTSRGRDTYGYNIVTLYADGKRVARCMGGGYDMQGTVLGDYIQARFQAELLKLRSRANAVFDGKTFKTKEGRASAKALYGMTYNSDTKEIVLDGACGFSSIERIINALGFSLSNMRTRGRNIYILANS